uniref:Uncharacterized protein n=1 Tax=Anguilla anguilla TaxID=7936 RepID=A0A0E9VSQ6_ANGAN
MTFTFHGMQIATKTSVCHYPRMLHWALGQTVVVKVLVYE